MFTLALTSGLREGELIVLLWSDLDVEQKELTIQEERIVKSRKPVVYGERKRVVPLAHQTVRLLETEHQKHPNNPWMFPHPGTGKPYSRTMIRRLHDKILEKAGIDHIRLEDLRHTFAIHSLQGGMKEKELSTSLGHTRADFLVRRKLPALSVEEGSCEGKQDGLQPHCGRIGEGSGNIGETTVVKGCQLQYNPVIINKRKASTKVKKIRKVGYPYFKYCFCDIYKTCS